MTELPPSEVARRFESGEVHLLDVREPAECGVVSIVRAQCIPLGQLPERVSEIPRDVPIAVLCHHGVRSAYACEWLAQNGFSSIINVAGGIDRWAIDVAPNLPRY